MDDATKRDVEALPELQHEQTAIPFDTSGTTGPPKMQWMNLTREIIERTGAELDDEGIAAIETVRDLLERVQQNGESEADAGKPLQHPEQVFSSTFSGSRGLREPEV